MSSEEIPDSKRIRTRAFFLWKNKTGHTWRDAATNWTEAHNYEAALLVPRTRAPLHKYTWPYSVHFTDIAMLEMAGVDDAPTPRRFCCTTKQIASLRGAYDRVAAAAAHFDYVCAFACGAVALLHWIAVAECRRLFGHETPRSVQEIDALQERLHLFPGLSWGIDSEVAFVSFLAGVPSHARVMLVDCSFTGGAIAAAVNAAAGVDAGPRTSIHAIVDRNQLDEGKLEGAYRLLCERRIGPIVLQEVESLLAEDFPELLGYDALQATSRLQPQWRPGTVVVHDTDADRFNVRSSQPLHSVFREVLLGEPPPTFDVERATLNQTCAETLYAVRNDMLDKEYNGLVDQLVAKEPLDPFTFNKKKGELCGRWRRQMAAIARAFDVSDEGVEPPAFCASVAEEKAILRGELRTVSIEATDYGVIVSVRVLHADSKGRQRSDFSFMLTDAQWEQVKESASTLQHSVPFGLRSDFDAMWEKQTPKHRNELDDIWTKRRDAFAPPVDDGDPERP